MNVAGLPAISMPVLHEGMPFGVQAIGRPGDELGLLVLARELERELAWDQRRPDASGSGDAGAVGFDGTR